MKRGEEGHEAKTETRAAAPREAMPPPCMRFACRKGGARALASEESCARHNGRRGVLVVPHLLSKSCAHRTATISRGLWSCSGICREKEDEEVEASRDVCKHACKVPSSAEGERTRLAPSSVVWLLLARASEALQMARTRSSFASRKPSSSVAEVEYGRKKPAAIKTL